MKKAWETRFCNKSCSAKWRTSQPWWREKAGYDSPQRVETIRANVRQYVASTTPIERQERARKARAAWTDETMTSMKATFKAAGHKPKVRGGNGRGLTVPQRLLLDQLGEGWIPEYSVGTGPRRPGVPTHYPIDLANPQLMMAVEVDGNSHRTVKGKERDARKEQFLIAQGWCVLRFWNKEVMTSLPTVIVSITSKFPIIPVTP